MFFIFKFVTNHDSEVQIHVGLIQTSTDRSKVVLLIWFSVLACFDIRFYTVLVSVSKLFSPSIVYLVFNKV